MTKQSVGGVDTVFAYDDYGRMVSKYVAGVCSAAYTYRCGWSGAKPQRRQGLDRREARRALGSTRRLRDQDKDSLGQYEYTPYGETYAESGETITRKYVLLEWDAIAQMHFAPYRYYMPGAGRWISRDPLGMVDGPNAYCYAGARPVVNVDSLGLLVSGFPTPVNYRIFRCYERARQVAFYTIFILGYKGGYHDRTDFMRHCTASCLVTLTGGSFCGWFMTDVREWLVSDNDPYDYKSNRIGRDCAACGSRGVNDCDACCARSFAQQ